MCLCVCVGGDSENESCRIRSGSETRGEPTKRRMLQTAREIHHLLLHVPLTRLLQHLPALHPRTLSLPCFIHTQRHTHTPAGREEGRVMGTRRLQAREKLVRKDGEPLEKQRRCSRAEKRMNIQYHVTEGG